MNLRKWIVPAVFTLAGTMAQAADGVDTSLDEIAQQIVSKTKADGVPIIGISTFTHSDGTCSELSNYITEFLVDSLFNAGDGQIELIERSQLSAIFRELELVYDGTIAPDAAKKLGEIEGVDALVSGSLIEFGERIKLQARLISTENGKLFSTARSDFPLIGSVSKMTATRSRGACGFAAAPGAAAAPVEAVPQQPSPNQPSLPQGFSLQEAEENYVYVGDVFSAQIVKLWYNPSTGDVNVVIRATNTSDNKIVLAFKPNSIVATDTLGLPLEKTREVTGIRNCKTQSYRCNGQSSEYATTVPAGKALQMNMALKSVQSQDRLSMALSFDLVVTPNASDPKKYSVVNVGYFDIFPEIQN